MNKHIKWFGELWCGFFVDTRLIDRNTVVLSFGVGTDITFDLGLYNKGVRNIYLFDPSSISKKYIQKIKLPASFSFYAFGLSDEDKTVSFFMPKDENKVSGSSYQHQHLDEHQPVKVEMKKLSTTMNMLNISHIDILKIDIEGSEFDVIKNMMEEKIYPMQICVEYHSRYFEDGQQKLKDSINLLLSHQYELCAQTNGEEYLFCYKN
ncbi:MAG: FkbM family methyltransferase [Fimbriimonadaceae bacterium]|nr:FkbM family methyltransferase [Chitinophagales bacterium]